MNLQTDSPSPETHAPLGSSGLQWSARSLDSAARIGDLVFTRIGARPFQEIGAATGSWANHVGVVIDTRGAEPRVGESRVPLSCTTTLRRFVGRSRGGRFALARLHAGLTPEQADELRAAAGRRSGTLYDTGFNLHSRRQFCSRYVHEVMQEATGIGLGDVETFEALWRQRPEANLLFWNLWFFGRIPWARETITPASLLRSAQLQVVMDGCIGSDMGHRRPGSSSVRPC